MRVVVLPFVEAKINAFYDAAMINHPLLSEETVMKKKERMIASLQILQSTQGFQRARINRLWIEHGWRELIVEGFHFAFEVVKDKTGEKLVLVHDVEHSLLYH